VPRAAAAVLPGFAITRSAAELNGALTNLLSRREDGRWGVMVVSLTRGDTLFAREPDTPVLPASTLKMFTSVLAFDRLGPDWRFRTEVLRAGTLGADSTLTGDLVLRGDGDPTLSRRFWAGPEFGRGYDAPMRALARRVAAAGVKRVTGGVIGDASAFEARTIPEGWLSRYAGSGYAAPFGALTLNENIVVVAIHPDGRVLLEPATRGLRVENGVRVVRGGGTAVRVHRAVDGHVVARGTVGRSAPVTRLQLTVDDPTLFAAGALAEALEAEGVKVEGGVRAGRAPAGATALAGVESPPLATIVAVMNRESINVFAEDLFRRATHGPARDGEGSAAAGNALLQRFLAERAGVSTGAVQVSDGSGLSVLDRVTARAMVHMLGYAHRAPWGPAFHASLPVAGESALMRHRMPGTPAAGNLHAKTGTTNDVIALGGYTTAENGEVLAFGFVFNGRDRWNARATIDAMGATLASFAR
jgi:D-alanyl-D-alanine carboxypeptidase/D-alanyl-D-alanine-endopeptidase (penicillin-binding protein 4)